MKFKTLICIASISGSILPQVFGGDPIISPGDPVLAIDEDIASNSNYPVGEGPGLIVDGSASTKYLNFGRENSGFIVTPAFGSSVLRSFVITTANDSVERDPTSVVIYGTNTAIVSSDNSGGAGESWTRIAELDLDLPDLRFEPMAVLNVPNEAVFSSYKFVFPTMKGPTHNSMQISEVQFWDGSSGQGSPILRPNDPVLAIHEASPESGFPGPEGPENLFDESSSTKYLNFGRENSGFIVTPSSGPSVAGSFILTTANDFNGRDPISWEIFGTNAEIVTENNGTGQNEPWTLLGSGTVETPLVRFTATPEVFFDNAVSYTSYKFLVTSVRSPLGANIDSTQYSEFQLFTSDTAPQEIKITSIVPDLQNDEATITWDAPAGQLYLLQSSPDLLDWNTSVTGGAIEVESDNPLTFQPPAGGKVFYRIIRAPIR
jgi:hypothetical protein